MHKKRKDWLWLFAGGLLAVGVAVAIIVSAMGGKSSSSDTGGLNNNASANNQPAQSKISVLSPDFYDFGDIKMKDGLVKYMFSLKNEGSEPILVSKAYTSCMCTKAKIVRAGQDIAGPFGMPGHGGTVSRADITINPGEEFKVEAVYDPAAHGPSGVGLANRSIYLETNSQVSPKIELKISANVSNN